MPNGTLCGKAIVELLLAHEQGVPAADAEQHVVEKVGLPKRYLIAKERLRRAREMQTVEQADAMGIIGNHTNEPCFDKAEQALNVLYFEFLGFEFKLAVDKGNLWSRSGMLMRLQLRGSNSVELPVVLTPFKLA
ncbi:hypothetical protein EXIGLDRAFT_767168 [Exidia glandulosa HHB12029]|uniref:Uncharacterized protein n=1 Tax=Exidia glandulosa HHB12029 TaxID=1314781 RepID=A0A165J743_EXIGL|nr:hypothetical protein EXIGLDRAFT_767168 [Exidia glandulosa HHB12029]